MVSSRSPQRNTLMAGVLIAGIFLLAGLGITSYLRKPRSNSVMRGWRLARSKGCFSCHGPNGAGGIPNPGSEETTVPAWDGGMLMMYVESVSEIEEWIRYGSPRRLRKADDTPAGHNHREHPGGTEKGKEPLLSMPAFGAYLSGQEIHDLAEYVRFAGSYQVPRPDALAQKGYQTARRLGCFGCHRQGGRVGSPNPGSLKGYIPPWLGPDFEDLVRNDAELHRWIRDGKVERLESNPVARFFTGRQLIRMPSYGSLLNQNELDSVVAYIRWLSTSRPHRH